MIRKTPLVGVGSALVAFLAAGVCNAATYYVSASGNSANNGTAAAPWREIRDALPHLAPGDVVFVGDGGYRGFTMEDIVGTAGAPITIRATGANAVVNVTNDRSDNRDTIKISFCSYVVIDGLTAFNAIRAAVRVDQSDHVAIRNGVFGNNTVWGIFTNFSDDLLLEGNVCYGSVQQHGIYVSNTCVNPVVRGNRAFNNFACGLHFNGDVYAGGVGLITGALVEKNVLYNNGVGGGAAINMDGVRNSTIRNNLLFNNHASGIALFQINGALGPSGNSVYHNTVDMASDARWALVITNSDATSGPIHVRNNVFNNRSSFRGGISYGSPSDVSNTDSDYNILDKVTPDDAATVYSLAQWKSLGRELHSLSASNSSLFVSPEAGDYHLLGTAPALGAGQPVSTVLEDLEGMSRPSTGPVDIGAYQLSKPTEDPPAPTEGPQISIADAWVAEGNKGATKLSMTVTLSSASAQSVTVNYNTMDGTATGKDYTAASGTLTFQPGETTKSIVISIKGDRSRETDESFSVHLNNAVGATIGDGVGVATIVNDD